MKRRVGATVLALMAASVLAGPVGAAAAVDVPEDCAVPPEIDLTQFNVVIGSERSEVLHGTAGPDFICGLLGDDVVFAGAGDDLVLGDTSTFFGDVGAAGGRDTVFAGAGSDTVLPGPGDDTVFGQAGDDFLALAVGNDVGHGGPGADGINGGFGRDVVAGDAGNDELVGGSDDDVVDGGAGDDVLLGELPPGSQPPRDVPVPAPATRDVCLGGPGTDAALDCDTEVGVEGEFVPPPPEDEG
ncbi:calcium-binding protein [Cellulomonas aerilata]|uniref:Hemolysin expression modulating protein n=1 Tax=Cellulomonas aerilata TaxID=515326 RepID=A0A512D9F8_9CELL|nr:calcium-binding protein [Cellulomonas aerilata]GEO33123.1 hypothetical protein CAE01nite_08480 [Cellulomonas aerilata]